MYVNSIITEIMQTGSMTDVNGKDASSYSYDMHSRCKELNIHSVIFPHS